MWGVNRKEHPGERERERERALLGAPLISHKEAFLLTFGSFFFTSKKVPKHNCKQKSSVVGRTLPTVSKKAASDFPQTVKHPDYKLEFLGALLRALLRALPRISRLAPLCLVDATANRGGDTSPLVPVGS